MGIGDLVLAADGETLTVGGIDWETRTAGTAYNLSIDDIHTYFVSVGIGEVLVHNVGGCGLSANRRGTR